MIAVLILFVSNLHLFPLTAPIFSFGSDHPMVESKPLGSDSSLSHDLELIWKLPSLSITQSWTMRSTQLNSHESLWRVPYRSNDVQKGQRTPFVLVPSVSLGKAGRGTRQSPWGYRRKSGRSRYDRHGKHASGRIVRCPPRAQALIISTCERVQSTNQQEGAGKGRGKYTAAISAIRS